MKPSPRSPYALCVSWLVVAAWVLAPVVAAPVARAQDAPDNVTYDWGGWFRFDSPRGWEMVPIGDDVVIHGPGVDYGVSLRSTSCEASGFAKSFIDSMSLYCGGFDMAMELEGFRGMMPTVSLYYDFGSESEGLWTGLTLATPLNGQVLVRSVRMRLDAEGNVPADIEDAGSAWLADGFAFSDTLVMRSWLEGPQDIMARAKTDPDSDWIVLRENRMKMKLPEGWSPRMYYPPYAPDYPYLQLVGPGGTTIRPVGPDTGSLVASGPLTIQRLRQLCKDKSTCPDCSSLGEYQPAHHPGMGAIKLSFTCDDGDRRMEYLAFESRTQFLWIEYPKGGGASTEDIEASLEFMD